MIDINCRRFTVELKLSENLLWKCHPFTFILWNALFMNYLFTQLNNAVENCSKEWKFAMDLYSGIFRGELKFWGYDQISDKIIWREVLGLRKMLDFIVLFFVSG